MYKYFFFIIISLISYNALAQRFEGGVIAGFNASQIEGDTYKGYYKPGILAGGFVQTDLSPVLFGGMEIKFSQKGARNKYDKKNPSQPKYIARLDYIDIPFYLGFRTNESTSVIFGASAGYLFKGKEYNEYGEFVEEDQNPFNVFDIQGFAGFRFNYLDMLELDLRFAYSILPIRGLPGNTNYYWNDNQFNNVLSLAIYYKIERR